jgi:hypothetical protein
MNNHLMEVIMPILFGVLVQLALVTIIFGVAEML